LDLFQNNQRNGLKKVLVIVIWAQHKERPKHYDKFSKTHKLNDSVKTQKNFYQILEEVDENSTSQY